MAYYRATIQGIDEMAIDWSKPLESAISGRPLTLVTHRQNPDNNGEYHLQSADGFPLSFDECGFNHPLLIVRENGMSLDGVLSVRNTAPAAPSKTLRDEFAMAVIPHVWLQSSNDERAHIGDVADRAAYWAYRIADAMMQERVT
jgi:hypothetical protein